MKQYEKARDCLRQQQIARDSLLSEAFYLKLVIACKNLLPFAPVVRLVFFLLQIRFDTNFLMKFFLDPPSLDPNLSGPNIFWTTFFLDSKIFGPKICLDQKIFDIQNFLTKKYLNPNFFATKFFLLDLCGPKFFQSLL